MNERRANDTPFSSKRELGVKGFSDGISYNAVRPDYPGEAMSFFASTFGLDGTVRVLDLGAGSGIFTRQIRDLVGEVVAVDPSASMRAAFQQQTPDLEVLDGSDIAIPLEDASVDVVFVAQAFHWFEPTKALGEIHRVLRTGGGLGLIWNERDESVPWVRSLSVAMRWDDFQPYETGRDFSPVLAAGPFVDIERATFRHAQTLSKEGIYQRVLTTSYISVMSQAQREELLRDVADVIDPLDEPLTLPYVTDVYRATAS